MADDLGWKDVGYHGSDIKTPNIDRLAENGARLEQFYAQPMCTPTRAALMTGRYPFRYGLQTLVIPSGYTYGLRTDEWLLPQALKEAGYETAIIGKWHLGHADPKYWPGSLSAQACAKATGSSSGARRCPPRLSCTTSRRTRRRRTTWRLSIRRRYPSLQKRANELAAQQVKPLLLHEEFGAMRKRLSMPPALPGEEFQLEDEQ